MSKIIFQQQDANRWVGADSVHLDPKAFKIYIEAATQTLLVHKAQEDKFKLTPEQQEQLTENIKKAKKLQTEALAIFEEIRINNLAVLSDNGYKSKNLGYIYYPNSRLATRIQNAYIAQDTDLNSHIQRPLSVCEKYNQLAILFGQHRSLFYSVFGTGKSTHSGYSYSPKESTLFDQLRNQIEQSRYTDLAKALRSLKKKHDTAPFTSIERNAENSFIQKKAWAIFATNSYTQKSGFVSRSGDYGEISAARLFDSDLGAKRTGSSMCIGQWEVMEVEVSLKKRLQFNPEYQNAELNAALAILEKQKIEAFFKEVSLEKIQAKMRELEEQLKNQTSIVCPTEHVDPLNVSIENQNVEETPTRKRHKI